MKKILFPAVVSEDHAIDSAAEREAARRKRVLKFYLDQSGPLIAWLDDEARRRGHDARAMAHTLGVYEGDIDLFKLGFRKTSQIDDKFALACSRYLGVAPIVVKLVAGRIPMTDFLQPHESEEEVIQRGFDALLCDPAVRAVMPNAPNLLSMDAKRALVRLHAKLTDADPYHTGVLPRVMHELQCAALFEADHVFEASVARRPKRKEEETT